MALKSVNKMIHTDRRVVRLSQVRGHPPQKKNYLIRVFVLEGMIYAGVNRIPKEKHTTNMKFITR